jgi:DNA-directed RNA polymerase I subunit RPA2
VNGNERCIRMLQVPRRNFMTAVQRTRFKARGPMYSDLGVAMRCSNANDDQSSITNTLHYLTTGGANLKFVARKQEFLVPIVILFRALSGANGARLEREGQESYNDGSFAAADIAAGRGDANNQDCATVGITDKELFTRIALGCNVDTFVSSRMTLLLQDARARYPNLNTADDCLAFIGSRFRRLSGKSSVTTDIDVGHYILRRYVLIHLPRYRDKLECLILMLRKLYALVAGRCGVDNSDSLQNQEILLPGHLLSTFVKEKFEETLESLRLLFLVELRKDFQKTKIKMKESTWLSKMIDRAISTSTGSVGKKVGHFLSTGNIVSSSGLDLMQVSGYTIVAERLNFLRYCAHFRSVHRGQFFMEMKTTSVRKLLPDQWGFICPVHTPDGGPCGLLGHFALKCHIGTHPENLDGDGLEDLDNLLILFGVTPSGAGGSIGDGRLVPSPNHLPVVLDGRVVGSATSAKCKKIAVLLRQFKVAEPPKVPPTLEIAMIPSGNAGSPFPGLFLFSGAARLTRPVLQRSSGKVEMIGPLEQAFMDIACLDEDIREGVSTHQELDPTNMLSLIANLTPFSDQNQSPRNMYQCQMGKQTMGTPCYSLPFRVDNKLYQLLYPQAPLVQTHVHGEFKMDEFPNGTNAVVGK